MHFLPRRLRLALPLCFAMTGCGTSPAEYFESPYIRGDLSTLTYRAVDRIVATAPEIARDTPLVVTSLSDTQNLDTSSPLGNIVADMMRNRLVQDGYSTSEIRLRNTVRFQQNEGEFLLSRDPRAVLPARKMAAILTGTYTASEEKVYVSLKLIAVQDAHILAGVDFVVPYQEVAGLLGKDGT